MTAQRIRQWEAARTEALNDALPRWATDRLMELLWDLAHAECDPVGAEVTVAALQDAVQAVRDGLV